MMCCSFLHSQCGDGFLLGISPAFYLSLVRCAMWWIWHCCQSRSSQSRLHVSILHAFFKSSSIDPLISTYMLAIINVTLPTLVSIIVASSSKSCLLLLWPCVFCPHLEPVLYENVVFLLLDFISSNVHQLNSNFITILELWLLY